MLHVTGFHNAAPQFRFVRRKNVLLSVDADKTDEAELQRAVGRAAGLLRPLGADVAEYTSRTETKEIPGHYIIYWELLLKESGKWPEKEVFDNCCLEMEEALNSVYRYIFLSQLDQIITKVRLKLQKNYITCVEKVR